MKTDISVFPGAKIGQNDHSNPYIESTVLSDIFFVKIIITYVFILDSSRYIYYFSKPWGGLLCVYVCV